MAYCPHCMQRVSGGTSCPRCKKPLGQPGNDNHLPVGHALESGSGRKYTLGLARGQGGFGITYIAMDLQTNQRVAIKEYYPVRCVERGGDHVSVVTKPGMEQVFKGGMESFIKEGTLLFQLNTLPCVVHVQDWFKANGTAYLVMEFLDGMPLHSIVAGERRIPAVRLMPLLPPLLRDLQQLHEADIVHRDIAPDNIMVMPDGTPKLLDFGSARAMENNKSMTVMLKQGFTPIEQYMSHGTQGPWTDIYALSATFYYCLTGVIPPSAPDRLYDENALRTPSSLKVEGLKPKEEAALLAGLRVQPTMRPQSVEAFAALFPPRAANEIAKWSADAPVEGRKPNSADKQPHAKEEVASPDATVYLEQDEGEPTPTVEQQQAKKFRLWRNILIAALVVLVVCLIIYSITARAEASVCAVVRSLILPTGWKGALYHV